MGLKFFISGTNSHTGCIPMAVSSGLKRSQRVSKCHDTPGAAHIRASHMASLCYDALGAEPVRTLHKVSMCYQTLGLRRIRASHKVSKCHETLMTMPQTSAGSTPNQALSDCNPSMSSIDMMLGRRR